MEIIEKFTNTVIKEMVKIKKEGSGWPPPETKRVGIMVPENASAIVLMR